MANTVALEQSNELLLPTSLPSLRYGNTAAERGGLDLVKSMQFMLFILTLVMAPAIAQTQLEINQEACSEYQTADKKLNAVYQQVLDRHKGDVMATDKIKNSQIAWLAFRDAQLDAIYPAVDKQYEYGSVYPMCNCSENAALIIQRIEQLSGWLNAEEGDVCMGSRQPRSN